MLKENKKILIFVFVFVVFIVVLLSVLYWTDFELWLDKESFELDPFSNIEEMHFTHIPITYNIDLFNEPYNSLIEGDFLNRSVAVYTVGYEKKVNDIRQAFEIIENITDNLISFEEVGLDEKADIKVIGLAPHEFEDLLNETYNESMSSDGILGMGIPGNEINRIINGSIYYQPTRIRIDEASWIYGRCVYFPTIEVHELLHVFGFMHTNKSLDHIMFPLDVPCTAKKVDEEIVSCLKWIYSNGKIGKGCSEVSIEPHPLNMTVVLKDFAWKKFPITYSIFNCKIPNKIETAVKRFQEQMGNRITFLYQENTPSSINFFCDETYKTNVYDAETDYWSGSWRPGMKRRYVFDENREVLQANITIFYIKECLEDIRVSQIEFVAVYRAIGLRQKEYGGDTKLVSCSPGTAFSSITREAIEELYGFKNNHQIDL